MSSLTIDQLKKSLTSKGVQLPPTGAKKSEYLKLYEQHVNVNESLGEPYSSDDDTPLSASWNVSSSSSPSKLDGFKKEIEMLTDDELYSKLQQHGCNSGPIVPSTRKIYEKKLVKVLSGDTENGLDESSSMKIEQKQKVEEFSDSDIDDSHATKKTMPEMKLTTRARVSVSRDSPKPVDHDRELLDTQEYKRQQNILGSDTFNGRKETKATKFTFIETIKHGERYIEPTDLEPMNLTYRFNRPQATSEYIGTWNPKVGLHSSTQFQTQGKSAKATSELSPLKKIVGGIGIAVLLALAWYTYYQWSTNDPYKLIQHDAEREILEHGKN